MIPLLPRRQFDLVSQRPPDEVVLALSKQVEPRKWIRSGANRRFEGTISGMSFDVSRVISYRNSFRPRIRGIITPQGSGSRIAITMSLHTVALVFLLLWVGLVCTMAGYLGLTSLRYGGSATEALIPLGLFVFAWVMTIAGFWFEAWKAERLLRSITGGTRAPARAS
ncbi:MAG: hypothetical protein M3020_12950 [Myxococcota bacterium]|nr:hypothetical protein [Myxococcota bacterium]